MSFLSERVENWNSMDGYNQAMDKLKAIHAVNDSAERAVKMTTDFLNKAKTEEHFQNVLQVVEKDRKTNPNLRKKMKFN